jgi:ComF family protein
LGKLLARLVYQGLKKDDRLWWGVEVIIPVPLHPARKKARGFNQSRVLARELGKIANIDIIEGVLVKHVNVPPQTTLTARERKKNIKGAFKVRDKAKIKNKTILLLDDVFTTGATIQECSAALINAGAKEVRGITVAQA